MAAVRRERTLAATPSAVWQVLGDPHHMPRWWPGVQRMEDVGEDRFTQVFTTKRGKPVRMDFRVLASEPPARRSWVQELAGTPFERFLNESTVEVVLEPVDSGTRVRIIQSQKLRGYSKTGALLFRRATKSKLDEALDGLARAVVG